MRRLLILPFLALLPAQAPRLPFTVEESGRGYRTLQAAIDAIGDSRSTIVISGGVHRQCGVQAAGMIVYRAYVPGATIFDGVACEGKAALVLRGRGATVDGVVFQNIFVPDRNGAGIRLERGDLDVRNSMFLSSEQGIVTADDPSSAIRIERSTFSGLGGCQRGMCSHSVSVGDYRSLAISQARFQRGTGGHYVKSRAEHVRIVDSSFDDSRGSATNSMIDLPAGATGAIARNEFVQGVDKAHDSAFVAVAAEARDHSSAGLTISANRAAIAPGVRRATFVADWSGESIRTAGNTLGAGIKAFERRD